MLNPNPIASEAIFSATYVDNYIDSVENLPLDVQRQLSRIRDIDVQYRNHLRDVDLYHEIWNTLESSGDNTVNRRSRAIARMQASLILAQERGDEKMQIVNQLQELIDHKTRQLDLDQRNLNIKEEHQQLLSQRDNVDVAPTPQKIARSQSPTRDVLTNAVSSLLGDSSMTSGNVCSEVTTPTSERMAHPSAMVGNICGSGNGMQNNTSALASNGATAEIQRSSTGKRRRRHDTANSQSQIDSMCGNESNSASNEAAGSSSGADKNAINSGTTQHKVATNVGNTVQKKNSSHGQANAGGVLCAGNNGSTAAGAGTGNGAASNSNNAAKKKKRKARGAHAVNSHNTREDTPPPDLDPIDPDEPTYCLCDQISFGEMILCDNDLCPIEWFHFSCVSLVLKPKGKWYCPNCRGDRPNIMKPKAQFLKELERYNKEKEEKT